jgi:hypothetical protein
MTTAILLCSPQHRANVCYSLMLKSTVQQITKMRPLRKYLVQQAAAKDEHLPQIMLTGRVLYLPRRADTQPK